MDLQTLDVYMRYVPWSQQKIDVVGANDEFLHGCERRRTRRTTRPDQRTPFGDASGMRKDSYVEAAEGDSPVEVFLQRLDHTSTGERPMRRQHNQADHH